MRYTTLNIKFNTIITTVMLAIAVSSCGASDNELSNNVIHSLKKAGIHDIPSHLNVTNEYLPLAIRYVQQFGFDEQADELLRYALSVKIPNQRYLVNYYLKELLKANSKNTFDKIYSKYHGLIDKDYEVIFDLYHHDDPNFISHLSSLPSSKPKSPYGVKAKTAEFLPTIIGYITLHPDILCADQTAVYLSSCYRYIETDEDKDALLAILEHFTDSPTLNVAAAFITKNKQQYAKNINAAIAEQIAHFADNTESDSIDKLDMIKDISIKLGQRQTFASVIKTNQDKHPIMKYYFCEEQLNYHGKEISLTDYKPLSASLSQSKSELGRIVRLKVLNLTAAPDEQWVSNVISYYNDFGSRRDAQDLLNLMMRIVIEHRKPSILTDKAMMIDISRMSTPDKISFYYDMYLIDKDNPKWRELIDKYPFSYPCLTLHGGLNNHFFPVKNEPAQISNTGKEVLDNVESFLTFNLANEIDYRTIDPLNGSDKYHIYQAIGSHYNKHENYLMGIKYHIAKCDSFYDEGYNNITMKDFRILYPLHYKDLVIKYAKQNQIEPAFAYGIMREESRFNHAILSYVGAVGLMQIMPSTGEWIAKRSKTPDYDLTNPADNIRMGTYYLNFLKYYTDDMRFIAAGYNAGPGRAKQWLKNYGTHTYYEQTELIPIHETRNYVRRVMNSYYIYKYLLKQ